MRRVNAIAQAVGVLRTRDLAHHGVSPSWLKVLFLEYRRVGPGVFVSSGEKTDRLLHLARKYPGLTLGLTSALWLTKVLPVRPPEDCWVLGARDGLPTWAPPGVRYLRSRRARDDRVALLVGPVRVPVHLPLHAALDCIRYRRVIGEEQMLAAVRATLESGVVSLVELLAHARGWRLWGAVLEALEKLHVNLDTASRYTVG